jgi:hypothetical protein
MRFCPAARAFLTVTPSRGRIRIGVTTTSGHVPSDIPNSHYAYVPGRPFKHLALQDFVSLCQSRFDRRPIGSVIARRGHPEMLLPALLRRLPRGAFRFCAHREIIASLGSDGLSASLPPVEFGPSRSLAIERRRRRAGKQTKIFLKERQRHLSARP